MSAALLTPGSTTDPHLDAVITRAETGRGMLERLGVIGMRIAEDVGERAVQAALHPEPRHEPCRAFASVLRAVRYNLAFQMWIDTDILAMRKGERPSIAARSKPAAVAAGVAAPVAVIVAPLAEIEPSPLQARVRGAVWEAVNRDVREIRTAQDMLDCLHERLIEGEDYDAFLALPFREAVAAICADLGLAPDWSGWSDEVGFAPRPDGPRYAWQRLWAYNPARAEARRRRMGSGSEEVADEASALPGPEP